MPKPLDPPPEVLLPLTDAARRLGVGRATALRMVNDGDVIGVRVRSRIKVLESSVSAYLLANLIAPKGVSA